MEIPVFPFVILDDSLLKIVDYLQANYEAERLRGLVENLNTLAPILWPNLEYYKKNCVLSVASDKVHGRSGFSSLVEKMEIHDASSSPKCSHSEAAQTKTE